jgi:predicted Zn-dependent peptidase
MSKKSKTIESTIYPNLFHFVHQKSSHKLPICSIYLFCDIGSSFETDELRGIAHFLEHMLFQGTHTKTANVIFQEYDQIGSEFNAFTTKRFTCFYVKCHESHAERVLKLLEDMMQNSIFTEERIKKEKEVVKQENKNRADNYKDAAKKGFDRLVYKKSSFEEPVDDFRFKETMRKMNHNTLMKWYKWFYNPSNMVLSVVSRKPFHDWTKILFHSNFTKEHFHKKTEIPQNALQFPNQEPYKPQTADINHTNKSGSNNTHLVFGFRTVNQYSDKKYVFELLTYILNGMSGRLFTILRHEQSLVYNVSANSQQEEYNGYFAIYTEFSNQHLKTVIKLLLELCEELVKNGIREEEFSIGKSRIHGAYNIKYENVNTFAEHNGCEHLIFVRDTENSRHYQKKKVVPFQNNLSTFHNKITLNQINNTIKEYFRQTNMVISIVNSEKIDEKSIRRLCEKYP